MRTLPVAFSAIKFNSFKSSSNETMTVAPTTELKKKDKNKVVLPLVTAAVAVASLGVSAYALRGHAKVNEATLEAAKNAAKQAAQTAGENAERVAKEAVDGLKKQVDDIGKKVVDNQKWNDGYLRDLSGKVQDVAERPAQVVVGDAKPNRNFTIVDDMRLVQNTDNGGNRIRLNAEVRAKLRGATNKFVTGKDVIIPALGAGAVIWLPSSETKPEKEGGLGEVPVQMAKNLTAEFGVDAYIPRPIIEIEGKSWLKEIDGNYKYWYAGMKDKEGKDTVMDVEKVIDYEVIAYRDGKPQREKVEVFYGMDPVDGYKRLMFRNPNYFKSKGLYAGSVTAEEAERYTFFTRALYELMKIMKDPNSVTSCSIPNKALYEKIKAPAAIVSNDWHIAPLAALMRLLAPVEAANNELSPKVAEEFENMAILDIIHNADYQGSEYGRRDDMLNTLFDEYTYDIYKNALTGFTETSVNEDGEEFESEIRDLRNLLKIGNNVNMANMGMALSTKVKPVSPTYAKEIAEQTERGMGLTHIAKRRLDAGTMVGQSNGWDRSINEVSQANLNGFNNNVNKDKLLIFKLTIDSLTGLTDKEQARVDKVFKKHKYELSNYKLIIEELAKLDIPAVEQALSKLKKAGITEPRQFVAATADMSAEELKAARLHNKKMLFDHIKTMIEYNKQVGKEVFNIAETDLTDLSGIDEENLDKVPFFNMGVRFVDQKGVDTVSGAWNIILRNWDAWYPGKPRPVINIGGSDPSAEGKFKNMIAGTKRNLGALGATLVHWDGFVPNNILMAGSDWTMRPSHFEPDGDKWESLYKGTPTVMTLVGGHGDSIQDGYNGILTRRTVPEIKAEVAKRGLQGHAFDEAVLNEKINDYVEALRRSLDIFFADSKQDEIVNNAIHGNQSWVIKDHDGQILECPLVGHMRDLGFDLKQFPQISDTIK